MIQYADMGLGISLSAFLVCICDLIFTLVEKRVTKPQNKVYIAQLCILMTNAVSGMISTFTDQTKLTSDTAFMTLQAARYVYFLSHSLIPPIFYFYISFVVGRHFIKREESSFRAFLSEKRLHIIILLNEFIIALNPITEYIYYFDANKKFHRAWGEFVFVYAPSALWMIAAFVLLMRSWHIISPIRKNAIVFCYFLGVVGILIQLLYSNIRIEVLMETLGFTGILIFVENENDRMDVSVGAYNAMAFRLDISAAIKNQVPVKLILIRNIAIGSFPVPIGVKESYAPERAVAEYLENAAGDHCIYSVGRGTLAAVLFDKNEAEAAAIAERVFERFGDPWKIDDSELRLNAAVMMLDIPGRAASAEEVLYIADCPLPEKELHKVMSGSSLDWIVRRNAVEAAVKRGLAEGSFEVYYQPTYTIDRELHGAEALLRMKDRELGNVFPDEFIPVAEQLGLIGDIDAFVFREVCTLLATGEPQKNGVNSINVNLSVIECMRDGFTDNIIKIAEETGISGKDVIFEITETVAAEDQQRIIAVIEELRGRGFTFAIDDFGTGYSNLSATMSLGADIIKIDKSVLWGAEKSEQGRVLLGASLKMIKEMRKLSLTEGVETPGQLKLLEHLGCDYLQGYYFSKPLPKDDFLAFISN